MADKAKHAHGALERVDEAIAQKAIDAYDVLFLKNADGKPFIGWLDKDGNKVIVNENLDADMAELAEEIAKKVSKEEMEDRMDKTVLDVIDIANQYTDNKIEEKIAEVSGAIEIVEF